VKVIVEPVPVLNPAVAVPIDVGHVLVIVGMTLKIVQQPSISLPLEYSQGCILLGEVISPAIAPSIFIFQITANTLATTYCRLFRLFRYFRIQPPAAVTADCVVYYPKLFYHILWIKKIPRANSFY